MRAVAIALLVTQAVVGVNARAHDWLTERQIHEAIALGLRCADIPLMRIESPNGNFVVFIEGAAARVAEHAAVARQMSVPFDASRVTASMIAPDYRIWVQYTVDARRDVSVRRVVLQPASAQPSAGVIYPVRESLRPQLTLGAIPAHGIIEDVRWRWHEWIFDRLPPYDFHVVVDTSAGQERYAVTERVRTRLMRVCT